MFHPKRRMRSLLEIVARCIGRFFQRRDIAKRIEKRLENPDRDMIRKMKEHVWTHNIPLSRDDSTCGLDSALMDADMRVQALRKHIRPFLRDDFQSIRALDLGSFEGGLSFEMARLGIDVVGIEGRECNFLKSKLIEDYFGLPNLRFIHGDVNRIGTGLYSWMCARSCGPAIKWIGVVPSSHSCSRPEFTIRTLSGA